MDETKTGDKAKDSYEYHDDHRYPVFLDDITALIDSDPEKIVVASSDEHTGQPTWVNVLGDYGIPRYFYRTTPGPFMVPVSEEELSALRSSPTGRWMRGEFTNYEWLRQRAERKAKITNFLNRLRRT